MSVSDWSTTPSNNASTPGIDWSEGMLPSGVNNSARQMMADIATWLRSAVQQFYAAVGINKVPNGNAYSIDADKDFDILTGSWTAGSSVDIPITFSAAAGTHLFLMNISNNANVNANIAWLILVNTRQAAFTGGNTPTTVLQTQNTTGVATEPTSLSAQIISTGTNTLSLRLGGTTVGGTGTLNAVIRRISLVAR